MITTTELPGIMEEMGKLLDRLEESRGALRFRVPSGREQDYRYVLGGIAADRNLKIRTEFRYPTLYVMTQSWYEDQKRRQKNGLRGSAR